MGSVFKAIAPIFGAAVGSVIPGVGTSLGATLGGGLGSLFGDSGKKESGPEQPSGPVGMTDIKAEAEKPFEPKREEAMAQPESFKAFGSLNPQQESSAIATRGVYGQGVSNEEQSYYQNLINRQLVDDSGGLGDLGNLQNIDRTFLNQLGYGQSNPRDLLEAMQKWRTVA